MKHLGELITLARVKKDISMRELARRVELSTMYISEIERGKKIPGQNSRVLDSIAKELNIDPADIYESAAYSRSIKKTRNDLNNGQNQMRMALARSIFEADEDTVQKVWDLIHKEKGGSEN